MSSYKTFLNALLQQQLLFWSHLCKVWGDLSVNSLMFANIATHKEVESNRLTNFFEKIVCICKSFDTINKCFTSISTNMLYDLKSSDSLWE